MFKGIVLSLVLLIYSQSVSAKNDLAFNAVEQLFAAMSAQDDQRMFSLVTKDFQLLEHGEVWSIQKLAKAIKPNGTPYQRRNYFEVIKTVINQGSVWVSYWNKATFTVNGKDSDVIWLESAVMVQDGQQWKIQMLHSTRLEQGKVPPGVKFIEYVE